MELLQQLDPELETVRVRRGSLQEISQENLPRVLPSCVRNEEDRGKYLSTCPAQVPEDLADSQQPPSILSSIFKRTKNPLRVPTGSGILMTPCVSHVRSVDDTNQIIPEMKKNIQPVESGMMMTRDTPHLEKQQTKIPHHPEISIPSTISTTLLIPMCGAQATPTTN